MTKTTILNITFLQILLFSMVILSKGQTYVQGGIYANTTWSVANHPYIVTGQITLFPGDTLIVEPGVDVKFEDTVGLEVRGCLMAVGNVNNPILFTSNSPSPAKKSWDGILINNTLGGYAEFDYAVIEFADYALRTTGLNASVDMSSIKNTTFNASHVGISGSGYYPLYMDSCVFSYNMFGVWDSRKVISNSFFHDNDYGLFNCGDIDLIESIFCGNGIAVRSGGGDIIDCIFMNNTRGFDAYGNGFDNFHGNIISYNDVGMEIVNSIDSGNVICNNTSYNVVNKSSKNLSIKGNCWCEKDSTKIAQKIKDGYDDISLGLLDFQPFKNCDSTSIPSNLDALCYSQSVGIIKQKVEDKLNVRVYPNPTKSEFSIQILATEFTSGSIQIFDARGNLVENLILDSKEVYISVTQWRSGIYFYTVHFQNGNVSSGKIIKL